MRAQGWATQAHSEPFIPHQAHKCLLFSVEGWALSLMHPPQTKMGKPPQTRQGTTSKEIALNSHF